jgi:predicted phosphoribosyltransferase
MAEKNMHFKDRADAGQKLAKNLQKYKGIKNVVVYALPRGGVVIGSQVAKKLGCPLDLLIIRKIGHPFSEEYAIGAISEKGNAVFNQAELQSIDKKWLEDEIEKKKAEAKARRELYFKNKQPINPEGKIAIIVDDGIATGLTMSAAIKEIKTNKPQKIIVAVPVAPKESVDSMKKEVDEFISLSVPEIYLGAVGAYYENFNQVSDEEVVNLIKSNEK